jgi:uncharacterized SAM-binding protein YcdF (DUF218 family)
MAGAWNFRGARASLPARESRPLEAASPLLSGSFNDMPSAVSVHPVDALVVLGCRTDGAGGGAARRRTETAGLAYARLCPRWVIVSGGRRWSGTPEADAIAAGLVERGVPEAVIVRDLCSFTTLENAVYSSELLRAAGATSPAIVTCDWHLPRALACFEAIGVTVSGIGAPSRSSFAARLRRRASERVSRWLDERLAREWVRS